MERRAGSSGTTLAPWRPSRRRANSTPPSTRADKSLLLLDTANAYLELNLYLEALSGFQEATGLLAGSGMTHDQARALRGAGSALVALSDLDGAREALAASSRLFEDAGNTPLLASVMLEQAALLEAGGDRTGALAVANKTLGLVSGGAWSVQSFYTRLRLADLSLPDAREEAEANLCVARRLADGLALPQLGYRLDERLGRLRRLQGRDEEARVLLEDAIEGVERLRETVAHETMRASFLRDKTAAYEELLRLLLDRDAGDPLRAFAVAEKAKSRALADLLASGAAKRQAGPEGDPELAGRISALQADLNATYNRLLDVTGGDEPGSTPRELLRERAVDLEKEIGSLRLRATSRGAPRPSDTSDPFADPSRPDATGDLSLREGVMVAYHVVGDEVVAFVGSAAGETRVARNLGPAGEVSRLLRLLDRQWDRFRLGGEFVADNASLLERSAQKPLAALYAKLFAPLEGLIREAGSGEAPLTKLVVVPHGPLHGAPFHALFDGERYLLERFEISYAPSARIHALCQEKVRRGPGSKALVMGVGDPLIPSAGVEARAIARRLGAGAEALEGEEATLEALRKGAPGCGVLHLACHGLFRHDNPMFSSLKLHDGWLTAADVLELDLEGALVVLSACESGRNRVLEGDELIGLTRAFLGAGAATLVSSLWIVQDETTAKLMKHWYEGLRAGAEPAAALREAQLALKQDHPHPYYWAPFVLIGQR